MACSTVDSQVLCAYVAGDLASEAHRELELHLRDCRACAETVQEISTVVSLLRASVEESRFGDSLHRASQAIAERLEREPPNTEAAGNSPGMVGLPRIEWHVTASPPEEDLTGRTFDCYVLTGSLGGGGWGHVYRARNTALGLDVAVKALKPWLAADSRLLARFQREARVVARLDHPNIVRIHDQRLIDGLHFLIMEFVRGRDLRSRVWSEGAVPEREALAISMAVACALDAAHSSGIIHRDVKPQNILLADDGQVKLADFGLARVVDETFTATGTVLGSVAYMAPEQLADSKRAGPAADLYGLGCTLFLMLTGRPPFRGRQYELIQAHLHLPAPDVRTFAPTVSEGTAGLVAALLQKNPAERLSDARSTIEQISVLLGRHEKTV